jgi:hypothetical protein
MAPNKFISPLYLYTKSYVKYLGKKNIGQENVQKALDAVTTLLDNCCVLGFPRTKSQFLKGFYALLALVSLPKDYHKLKAVQTLLTNYIDCCV